MLAAPFGQGLNFIFLGFTSLRYILGGLVFLFSILGINTERITWDDFSYILPPGYVYNDSSFSVWDLCYKVWRGYVLYFVVFLVVPFCDV